ncbi:hypothetical protein DFH06DRAFT_439466 [Mycena polygramma]|nr:hypothetical protein DFH06DRAFT_439466 [Mycena polygramma]
MAGRPQQPGSHRPTASETAALATDRAQIARLDTQILALQLSLRALKKERKEIQTRMDDFTYPVFTLPNEIVAEVFLQFLPAYPKQPRSSGVLSPMMLGQICHRWREIAWSTPVLWRAISIRFAPFSMGRDSLLPLLEGWMTRAASLPLSISLSLDDDDDDDGDTSDSEEEEDDTEFRVQLIQVLVNQCARWEHVKLIGIVLDEELKLVEGFPMPMLRSLELLSFPGDGDLLTIIKEVPLLRNVTLHQNFQPSRLLLPLSQLTTLTMISVREPLLLDILAQTVNLIHCEARLSPYAFNSATLVRLEFLHSLHLLDGTRIVPTHSFLLDALTLPALQKLHIHRRVLNTSPIKTLNSFVARSGCSLQTLRILTNGPNPLGQPEALFRAAFPTTQITFVAAVIRHHIQHKEDKRLGSSSDSDEE